MSQYVLEWSKRSNCFHVQKLCDLLAKNQECFLRDSSHDYIALMVGSFDAVTAMAENQRDKLKERTKVKTVAEAL